MGRDEVYKEESKPPCHEDCWHYDTFGDVSGCGQAHGGWGGWPEPIEPGQGCLYPEKRNICEPIIVDSVGFCAALEGSVIGGGLHDNTQLVERLISYEV